MSMKKITSLIKMQLKDMPSLNVKSYSLSGSDAKDYTYTYNQLLYVMNPDENSVLEAIELIDSVINGEKLENSYENSIGTSNKVSKTKVKVNSQKKENIVPKKSEEKVEEKVEVIVPNEEKKEEQSEVEVTPENNVDNNIDNPTNPDETLPEEDTSVDTGNEEINNELAQIS